MNENLKTLGGSVDTNGPAIPNGEIAFGNSGGTGIESDSSFIFDKITKKIGIGIPLKSYLKAPIHLFNNSTSAIFLESSATQPNKIIGIRNTGTIYSPVAPVLGNTMIEFGTASWDGTNFGTSRRSNMRFVTTENWTSTGNGGGILFAPTLNGTTGNLGALWINNDGKVILGFNVSSSSTIRAKWHVRGDGIGLSNAVYVENNTPDSIYTLNNQGTAKFHKYGLGNKAASTLSKTKSDYSAIFATDGTVVENNISNGIYIPTITKNIASDTVITVYTHLYSRNDTIMNITGRLLVNNASGTASSTLQVSLPPGFTSDFTDALNDVTGNVNCYGSVFPSTGYAARVKCDTSTDRIVIEWTCDSTASRQEISYNINLRKK